MILARFCDYACRPWKRLSISLGDKPAAIKDEDFLIIPPPSPAIIAAQQKHYQEQLLKRQFRVPRGVTQDEPLFALYRIYEYLLVDRTIWYRNAFESFWRERDWAVSNIPDPQDRDAARYAFLACVTDLLVLAFNARIKLGLARHGPSGILLEEESEAMRNQKEEDKIYEQVPDWAQRVQPLQHPLDLLSRGKQAWKDTASNDVNDTRDPCFTKRNILIAPFHVHFT